MTQEAINPHDAAIDRSEDPSPLDQPVDPEQTPRLRNRRPASPPANLLSGLAALASVFSLVIALAAYRIKSQVPEAARTPASAPASSGTALSDQTVIGSAPTLAATPPPLAPPRPAFTLPAQALPPARGGDERVLIRQMNDEANVIMPETLPVPVPPEQYQELAGAFQKLAAKYFPDLGVKGSPLNREFVARYTLHRRDSPAYFEQPDWPVALTEECVEALFNGAGAAAVAPATETAP